MFAWTLNAVLLLAKLVHLQKLSLWKNRGSPGRQEGETTAAQPRLLPLANPVGISWSRQGKLVWRATLTVQAVSD